MSIQITHITLATVNTEAMVAFYNAVFDAQLAPANAYGTTLYNGAFAGMSWLFCPNEIAGVQAEQNRHQLRFGVPDLAAALAAVRNAGGSVDEDNAEPDSASVRDPDGNTFELTQA